MRRLLCYPLARAVAVGAAWYSCESAFRRALAAVIRANREREQHPAMNNDYDY